MVLRFLCLCLACGLSAAEATAFRIMALGDSITQGGKTFATYRIPLAAKLQAAGVRFVFVGSQKTDTPQGPLWHEGYGGKNAEFLATILEARLKANPANVLMLQAGHNHFIEEKPVAGIVAAHREMITTARRLNPKSIVFVAQVIPSGKLPKYSYILSSTSRWPRWSRNCIARSSLSISWTSRLGLIRRRTPLPTLCIPTPLAPKRSRSAGVRR
ncbi:hypothetical protein EMGBS8_09940 [Verrucomicrobiota bacterium]|nr:hypothetical protein EMGBS8_09940 [Verrucomicrobiota bacterium]